MLRFSDTIGMDKYGSAVLLPALEWYYTVLYLSKYPKRMPLCSTAQLRLVGYGRCRYTLLAKSSRRKRYCGNVLAATEVSSSYLEKSSHWYDTSIAAGALPQYLSFRKDFAIEAHPYSTYTGWVRRFNSSNSSISRFFSLYFSR